MAWHLQAGNVHPLHLGHLWINLNYIEYMIKYSNKVWPRIPKVILFSDFGECEGSVNPANHEKRVHTSLLLLFPISVLKYFPFMAIYHLGCSPLPYMYSYGLHIKGVKINTFSTSSY